CKKHHIKLQTFKKFVSGRSAGRSSSTFSGGRHNRSIMRDLFPGNRHIYKSSSSQEDLRRMTNDNDKLLTAGQVAEMFQLPRCTIYGWVHKKRIKVLKLSRKMIRFRRSDIEAFLQSRTQDAVQREAAVRPA